MDDARFTTFRKLTMIILFAIFVVLQCANSTIILDCTYSINDWAYLGSLYTCHPRIIPLDQTRNVVGVSQFHLSGKTDQDVKALDILAQQIDFVPTDINLFFSNLQIIRISGCPVKAFTKEDLRPFPQLAYFVVYNAQLTTISGDVFKYSPELLYLNLSVNKITNVGPGLLEHSPKMNGFRITNNLCINNEGLNSTAVTSIARELAFKCPPTVEMTEEIILGGENFHKAVNDQVELGITVVDDRVQQLEEEIQSITKNYTARIEALENFIFNLCASHAICS